MGNQCFCSKYLNIFSAVFGSLPCVARFIQVLKGLVNNLMIFLQNINIIPVLTPFIIIRPSPTQKA